MILSCPTLLSSFQPPTCMLTIRTWFVYDGLDSRVVCDNSYSVYMSIQVCSEMLDCPYYSQGLQLSDIITLLS